MGDPLLVENPSCSICLEDFDEETPFVKTKSCSHLFHKQCLRGWLQVNRTCPLCREDLGSGPSPALPPAAPTAATDTAASTPAGAAVEVAADAAAPPTRRLRRPP